MKIKLKKRNKNKYYDTSAFLEDHQFDWVEWDFVNLEKDWACKFVIMK